MRKLIITVAHGTSPVAALEYGVLLSETAELPEYLERLRQALFMTGAALRSAEVINGECVRKWSAPLISFND
jgi:hypothetical protein